MDTFAEAVARLKHCLRVSKDIEVAQALGLSKTAFAERKRRGAFPEKELVNLAKEKPELEIDVRFVLLGESARTAAAKSLLNFGPRLKEIRGRRSAKAFAETHGIGADQLRRLEAGEELPRTEFVMELIRRTPDKSPVWVVGGDAPKLSGQLSDLEVVLVQNYRDSSAEAQAAIRHQAAFFAEQQRAAAKT